MKRLALFILFVVGVSISNASAETVDSSKESTNKTLESQYPRFHFVYSYSGPALDFLSQSEELNLLAGNLRVYSSPVTDSFLNIGFTWYFLKNLGLAAEFDTTDFNLKIEPNMTDSLTYGLMTTNTGMVGLQWRQLLGEAVIFNGLIPEKARSKSLFSYCCSFYVEGKAGLAYINYSQGYIDYLNSGNINNFPAAESAKEFPALALKYRFGLVLYFPLLFFEFSVGGLTYIIYNHGSATGFSGHVTALSAGVYF